MKYSLISIAVQYLTTLILYFHGKHFASLLSLNSGGELPGLTLLYLAISPWLFALPTLMLALCTFCKKTDKAYYANLTMMSLVTNFLMLLLALLATSLLFTVSQYPECYRQQIIQLGELTC